MRLKSSNTMVPVHRSKESIERLLKSRGVQNFVHVETQKFCGYEIIYPMRDSGLQVKLRLSIPVPEPPHSVVKYRRERELTAAEREEFLEQEKKRRYRVLFYSIDAIFAAIDADLWKEEIILQPFMVMKNGKTISEGILPQLGEFAATGRLQLSAGFANS